MTYNVLYLVTGVVFVFSRYSLNFVVEELKNPNRSASILIGCDIVFENFRRNSVPLPTKLSSCLSITPCVCYVKN